jgi:Family of unknown function (DUF6328)
VDESDGRDHPSPGDAKQRVDRELIELLNELRVVLPGVQVLFAFLLVLPFQQRFTEIDPVARLVYFTALLTTAAGTAALMAPSLYHRLTFRRKNKERMLFDSNTLIIVGAALTAVSIALVIYLIAEVLFGGTVALVVTGGTIVLYTALWAILPLARRGPPEDDPTP